MRWEVIKGEGERKNMREIKNVKTTKDCGTSKELAFAEMMLEKNRKRKQEYYISFIVYLLWMLGINLLLDYQLRDPGDRLICMVLWIGMILWLSIFTERYYQVYFTLLGEHGEQEQNIMTVIRQFPFSVNAYGRHIRKQLCHWQLGIFCGTMLLSGLGMLIFVRGDYYPVFLWETQDSGKVLLLRMLGILLIALLMALIPGWIMQMKLAAVQKNQKNPRRHFLGKASGDSRKWEKEKKWLLICLKILLITILCVLNMIIEEWTHPVSRDGILFVQIPNLVIFAVIILMELMESVRTWYRYLQREPENPLYHQERIRQKKKIAIQLCVGILLFLLPMFYYDTYYENRIESRHFIHAKSYEWEDVLSYEVYCPVWGDDIQLKLYMKDGSRKKVLKTNTNYSEKYYSDYVSDYAYIERMVEQLDALGVEGRLTDADKIAGKINRDHVEDWEAWKNIRKRMAG